MSPEQLYGVCEAICQLGDHVSEYIEALQLTGFATFLPFQDFELSFAENQEEITLHQRIVAENLKEYLSRPYPPVYLDPEYRRETFQSSFLESLRAKRDAENGVPMLELETRYSQGEALWRQDIDPCERRMHFLQASDSQIFEAKWADCMDAMALCLRTEADCHATDIARAHVFDENGRRTLFAAVMARDAAPLGFKYDLARSSAGFPIVSKSAAHDWDLCLTIEDPAMFCRDPFEGVCTFSLQLRRKDDPRNVNKLGPGEILSFRYAVVVPGFFNAYRIFHDSDELETILKAHLCLYGLIAPIIEDGVRRILG